MAQNGKFSATFGPHFDSFFFKIFCAIFLMVCGGFGETATNHQKNLAKNPPGQPIPQKSSKNLDAIEDP